MIYYLWSYKIQLVLVFVGLLLFYVPSYLRKLNRFVYAPLYFAIPPFNSLNVIFDNYHYATEKDRSEKRKKMRTISSFSTIIDAIIIPLAVGLICTFFMTIEIFQQFLILLVMSLIYRTIYSAYNFSKEFYSTKNLVAILMVVYIIYVFVVSNTLNYSFYWSIGYIESRNYYGLILDLKTIIFRLIMNLILVSIVPQVFINGLTNQIKAK